MKPLNDYRPNPPIASTKVTVILYLTVLVAFALLYGLTAQRDVGWQDSGMFQYRVMERDYTGDLGLALAHPLYILMGRAAMGVLPGHEFLALNLLSSLGMAIALANLSLITLRLTGRWWISLAAVVMLGTAHTIWWLSTIAEVYTWVTALLSFEILLLISLIRRPRWSTLVLLAMVSGMGWSLHNFALLPLPVYLGVMVYLIARRQLPAWCVLPALGAYMLGAGLYVSMIVAYAIKGGSVVAAIKSALVGDYAAQVMGQGGKWQFFKSNAALGALNFINLLLPLAIVGWITFRKRIGTVLAIALGAVTLIEIIFVVRYPVPDQFTFMLPSLFMIALAAAVGLATIAQRSVLWGRRTATACVAFAAIATLAYAVLPGMIPQSSLPHRHLPFRDEARYWVTPWKHNEHSAAQFAQAAWAQLKPLCDAGTEPILVLDQTSLYPMFLTQETQGLCPRAQIQQENQPLPLQSTDPALVRTLAANRSIFVVSTEGISPVLRDNTTLVKHHEHDVLYQLQWKLEAKR